MNGLSAYQEASVMTQNKGRLIVMLYDGAIKFLKQAIRDIEIQDFSSGLKFQSMPFKIGFNFFSKFFSPVKLG